MSKVVSLRLRDDQVDRLQRTARRVGRTPSETAVLLLEESLRQREFAWIEFRDSSAGRQAYLKGRRLAVWQVASIARDLGDDVARTAAHLEVPPAAIAAALNYAEAYPREIEDAIADNGQSAMTLSRLLPEMEVFELQEDGAAPPR